MLALQIIVFLIVGSISGFIAGLLGIGGGIIIVPSLFFTLNLLGFNPEDIMYFSTSTALASMLLTTLASFVLHQRKKGIEWELIKRMAFGLVCGVFLAIFPGHVFSGRFLQLLFGFFLVFNGFQFIFSFLPQKKTKQGETKLPSYFSASMISLIIGFFSVVLGIAGGLFVGQYFNFKQIETRKAISTASSASFLITLSSCLFYVFFHTHFIQHTTNSSFFFGPIYLPAFSVISVSSMLTTFFGVHLIYSIDISKARKLFGGFCILMGVTMFIKAFI